MERALVFLYVVGIIVGTTGIILNVKVIRLIGNSGLIIQSEEVAPMQLFDLGTRIMEIVEAYELTQREGELVRLIYEGKSNGDIAEMLFISESTVKTHIYNIFKKMNIKNRIQLVCLVHGEEVKAMAS